MNYGQDGKESHSSDIEVQSIDPQTHLEAALARHSKDFGSGGSGQLVRKIIAVDKKEARVLAGHFRNGIINKPEYVAVRGQSTMALKKRLKNKAADSYARAYGKTGTPGMTKGPQHRTKAGAVELPKGFSRGDQLASMIGAKVVPLRKGGKLAADLAGRMRKVRGIDKVKKPALRAVLEPNRQKILKGMRGDVKHVKAVREADFKEAREIWDGFHEKAVNSKLKFTSRFLMGWRLNWIESWNSRQAAESPRLPWGTGGEKPPEGIWGRNPNAVELAQLGGVWGGSPKALLPAAGAMVTD